MAGKPDGLVYWESDAVEYVSASSYKESLQAVSPHQLPDMPSDTSGLDEVHPLVNHGRVLWYCSACDNAVPVEKGSPVICPVCPGAVWQAVREIESSVEDLILSIPGYRSRAHLRNTPNLDGTPDVLGVIRGIVAKAQEAGATAESRNLSIGIPRAWAVNEILTAANMNTYISEILKDLAGTNGLIEFTNSASFSGGLSTSRISNLGGKLRIGGADSDVGVNDSIVTVGDIRTSRYSKAARVESGSKTPGADGDIAGSGKLQVNGAVEGASLKLGSVTLSSDELDTMKNAGSGFKSSRLTRPSNRLPAGRNYLDVLSVQLTTTGNPVLVMFGGLKASVGSSITARAGRGSTTLATAVIDRTSGWYLPILVIDIPGPGTYTYKLQGISSNGSNRLKAGTSISVLELA